MCIAISCMGLNTVIWLLKSHAIMDTNEFKAITDFLSSNESGKSWPDSVLSHSDVKTAKRNFRAKCSKFSVVNGTLHYNHKKHGPVRVILTTEKHRILQACHSDPASGHIGINKTMEKISSRYYWPGSVYNDVETFIGKHRG